MTSRLETDESDAAHRVTGAPDDTAVATVGGAVQAAIDSLSHCRTLLDRITDAQYTRPAPSLRGATIGQHIRHALDHFASALASLDGFPIRYDQRARGTSIETSLAAAVEQVASLTARMESLPPARSDASVTICVLLTPDGPETDLRSTLARELVFATHHALHHHAMILGAAEAMGVELPPDFGKAPSTIRHERSQG